MRPADLAAANVIEAELRREIAKQILAQKVPCKEHPMPLPKPSCWTCGRNGAFHRAARIALGEFPEPPAIRGAEYEQEPGTPRR